MRFCKFHKRDPWWDPSQGKPPQKAKIENDFENFSLLKKFLTWASCPRELGHLKNLSIFLHPSSAPSSPRPFFPTYLLSSAPSSPRPLKVVCFLPYLLSSAPSSPRPLKVVHFLPYLLLSAPSSPHLISFWVRLRVLISFECTFEPSTIKSSAFPTLPPFECAFEPSFPFGVRLRALTSFECTFEPSTIQGSVFPNPTFFWLRLWALIPFEYAFEPSPHFFSSAPSSPRPLKVVCFLPYLLLSAPLSPHLISFLVRLRALTSYFSTWQVTHYNVTILKNPCIFPLGR